MSSTVGDLAIGITGFLCAGKDEAANFFVAKGFNYYSLADVLRGFLNDGDQEINRANLQNLGNELRARHGANYLAAIVREKMVKPAVIVSIRNPDEVLEFRKEKNFFLINIAAPLEIRYERCLNRAREGDEKISFEEFRAQEERELEGGAAGQQLLKVVSMADFSVNNDSSLEVLHSRLAELYDQLTKPYNVK